ncbi:RNA polymerase sigma factor [Chloroflexota bacterium]
MDEKEAIAKSRSGDVNSFNWLVVTYERQVYNLALSMLGNAHDAEDATQDAFVSAYRSIRRFKSSGFKQWICRIAANACIDKMRYRKRHPASSIDNNPIDPPSNVPSEQPEEYALRMELRSLIDSKLALLPAELRLSVVLVDVQGMSYDEAAQVMGCALGTVKSRISRGRQQMRKLLLADKELLPAKFRHNI